VSYMSKLISS